MAIKKRPVTPRQKMINLMYIVLMAMLALNISTEVLHGFSIVEESLNRTTANSGKENNALYQEFKNQMLDNPEKVKAWFDKATRVKEMSDSLYDFAQELKVAIVRNADGPQGDVHNIQNTDNLEAAGVVMLAPGTGKGKKLYNMINSYRERILQMITDPHQKSIIASNLSTVVPRHKDTLGKNWQEYMFENMPVAAAVTLLSKLQNDVRYAEGEVLHTLVSQIDMKDIRVNKLSAWVIPEKTTLYAGERFNARIVMAAVDTTQQPIIYVNGARLNTRNGQYSFTAGGVGEHQFSGYILMKNAVGDFLRRNFIQKYTVIPTPNTATVAADLMNVLYAGFQNPMSVSMPGIAQNAVSLSASGARVIAKGNGHYTVIPSAVGQDVSIRITGRDGKMSRSAGPFVFHVRKLPDPTAYIAVGTNRFKGGGLAKGSLMGAPGIHAAIDDGLLDIPFRVTGFETVFFDNMGNAVPMASSGSSFTGAQREQFRHLGRGKRFYITHVRAVGPDGIARQLNGALEVIVR
ncbi:MAG: gliding motility protein GldM [Prevotellaceae bacterium]|nr:gliding motility protein GldM [Prevotellaceae bacterium]